MPRFERKLWSQSLCAGINCGPLIRFGLKANSMAPSRTPPRVTRPPAMSGGSTVDTVAGHLRALEAWARHCPENFENRAALVAAELARIEGAGATPDNSTSKPSGRRATTASSITRPSPWNSPRSSTRPVVSTGLRRRTCGTRVTAISVGERTEKSGSSIRSIHISSRKRAPLF